MQPAAAVSYPPACIRGRVRKVVFRSPSDGWSVLSVVPEGKSSEPVTVTGCFVGVAEGDDISVSGRWVEHRRYGLQVEAETWEKHLPATEDEVASYLAGFVKGVGPTTAREIARKLGPSAIERIAAEGPSCLSGIRLITPEKAGAIARAVSESYAESHAVSRLLGLGLSARMAVRVFRLWGAGAADEVRKNPYALTRVSLIGFYRADVIAKKLGVPPNSPHRLDAGVEHALSEAEQLGHCYLPAGELKDRSIALLTRSGERITGREVEASVKRLASAGRLTLTGGAVYRTPLYRAEAEIARKVKELARPWDVPPALGAALARFEARAGIRLDPEQRRAVERCFSTGISVLTGGPGTGKTQTVRAVAAAWEEMFPGSEIALCAPTGRAAKRMEELSGRPASTIHRLLSMTPEGEPAYDWSKPLPHDLVIVDEFSMVDARLAASLLSALKRDARILIVGDSDQLPSVGPGYVLSDIISFRVRVTRLSRIHRQSGDGAAVVENAARIREGLAPVPRQGFAVLEAQDQQRAQALAVESAVRLAQKYGPWGVQVLSPMKKGEAGTKALNDALRERLNPPGPDKGELRHGQKLFRVGDKVMQTQNDYESEVYNGDVGRVLEASADGLVVAYPGKTVEYAPEDLDRLTPAWAVTVHKSQGGEWPAVVLALMSAHYVMLRRDLLYTAVTRAKKEVVVVGQKKALWMAARNAQAGERYTFAWIRG
ncbi:MAG: ATP-dependent RecD-like DNA helicase [Clostridia bacterium]|nr:ATP-dependent RecD-like DNA helicase [Clostridia bacterium]